MKIQEEILGNNRPLAGADPALYIIFFSLYVSRPILHYEIFTAVSRSARFVTYYTLSENILKELSL